MPAHQYPFIASRSVSLSNQSTRSASPAQATSEDPTETPQYSDYEQILLERLNINLTLARNGGSPIRDPRTTYKRYTAALAAQELAKNWQAPPKQPTQEEVACLFISRGSWYQSWIKNFQHVHLYPDMVAWLEGDDDIDPWDDPASKTKHTMADIKIWCENAAKEKEKEKRRAAIKASSSKSKAAGKR